MSPKKAFLMYWGIKLHFSSLEYDMLTYGINTKGSISKYESMSEGHKFRFEFLSQKYPDVQDLSYAMIGCVFDSVHVQFDSKEDIVTSFFKFKSRRESISYVLKSEINKYKDNPEKDIEKVIFKYFSGEYSPELILLLTYETDALRKLYESPNFTWGRDKILRLIKYQSFFNTKKYLPLLSNEN